MNRDGATFVCHDMREDFPQQGFHAVFNLFTSFGYFDNSREDERVLQNMHDACLSGGFVIQDYLNSSPVLLQLPVEDVVERSGYRFKTRKHQTENHIVKDIEVRDGDAVLAFQEQVRIFSKDDLENLHRKAGLEVIAVFGDYNLGAFDEKTSPRIVLVSKKS